MVFIIDFDDSFTFNIAEFYYSQKIPVDVIHYSKIKESFHILNSEEMKVIVWGPGPGCPDDYMSVHKYCDELRRNDAIFHLGICLGHQLLLQLDGHELIKSKRILHGQKIQITIPDWPNHFKVEDIGLKTDVQRYNSLAIKSGNGNQLNFYSIEQEVVISKYSNGISYQFHPESIGTSFPSLFFQSSVEFLYNDKDERITQTHRYIRSENNSAWN